MPSEKYALEIGGPERLELYRDNFYSEIRVYLDGNVIGTFANDKEFEAGRTFQLPDGSSLDVRLVKTLFKTQARVTRNGQPLLDSASNPVNRFFAAYISVFLAGGFCIIFGTLALIYQDDSSVDSLGFNLFTLICGGALLYLGYLVKQKSLIALAGAFLIFLALGVWAITGSAQRTEIVNKRVIDVNGKVGYVTTSKYVPMPEMEFSARFILLFGMIQGFGAIRLLKKNP
jgi:hypothetical protein